MDTAPLDAVFAGLTPESPIADLCRAAYVAAIRAAKSDIADLPSSAGSDAATVAFLAEPDARDALKDWITAHRHDQETLAALTPTAREEVLSSAWLAYQATVMQARDAARFMGAAVTS